MINTHTEVGSRVDTGSRNWKLWVLPQRGTRDDRPAATIMVSDGLSSVYVWDLREAQPSQPDKYTFPSDMGTNTDGLNYDPINRTVYVHNRQIHPNT